MACDHNNAISNFQIQLSRLVGVYKLQANYLLRFRFRLVQHAVEGGIPQHPPNAFPPRLDFKSLSTMSDTPDSPAWGDAALEFHVAARVPAPAAAAAPVAAIEAAAAAPAAIPAAGGDTTTKDSMDGDRVGMFTVLQHQML